MLAIRDIRAPPYEKLILRLNITRSVNYTPLRS